MSIMEVQMEYYKEIHSSFEDNLEILHIYNGFLPDEKSFSRKESYCNCAGSYLLNGLKVSNSVKNGCGMPRKTRSEDNETCVFCDHYLLWENSHIKGAWRQNI